MLKFYKYLNVNVKNTIQTILLTALTLLLLTPVQANVIITGVYDATLSGGVPKGVELFVTADVADLSIYGIGSANNGQGTDDEEFTFPTGAYSAGTFIYVATDSTSFSTYFGFFPDFADGSMAINGDDAVELFMNGSVIDIFGDINVDGNGTGWEYLDGWAYRKDGTGPDGSTFVESNWNYSGVDALEGCSDNASCASVFPNGTYSAMMSSTPEFDFTTSGFSVNEGDDATVNVALTVAADCAIDVTLDASSTAPAADYTFSNQTLTFTSSGDLMQMITIPTVDNAASDGERTIVLNLENTDAGCAIGSVNQITITINDNDYQVADIVDVTAEDADGVATSLNALVTLTGIVYCGDFRGGGGYEFTLIDATGGIGVFSSSDINDYVVTEGDELQISGEIGQFRGLTQVIPDDIVVLSQGNSLGNYIKVNELNESTESMPIFLDANIIDRSQIGEAGTSYSIDVTNGVDTFVVRIDADVIMSEFPDFFAIKGIGGQFSSSSSLLDGYQVRPCSIDDIIYSNIDPVFGAEFSMYPNPVNNQLIIQTDIADYRIIISDVLGREVLTASHSANASINMATLEKGIYLITVVSEDKMWAERIVKE